MIVFCVSQKPLLQDGLTHRLPLPLSKMDKRLEIKALKEIRKKMTEAHTKYCKEMDAVYFALTGLINKLEDER